MVCGSADGVRRASCFVMSAGTSPSSSSVRALTQELRKLTTEPVEGFQVTLLDDENVFEWNVSIFGPPDTLLQGGYFKVNSLNHIV